MKTDNRIALTCANDYVFINSLQKKQKLGQLHEYSNQITSLYWKNSLAITGDQKGNLYLWDINQEKLIHNRSVFKSPIDSIDSYVDFIHTNIYFSLSKNQRKMVFHDIRTYKPLKTTVNLPVDILSAHLNPSGKIFLLSSKEVALMDIYQNFKIVGKFVSNKEQNDYKKEFCGQANGRQLTVALLWNQYAITGCDNGSIELYNSDTLQCVYGYGLCEQKITKLARIEKSVIALDQKGQISMAHFG